ncbi:MAG: ABC transporter ATP-binding protein [Desulfotalea sp.]
MILDIKNLSFGYNGQQVLRDINMSVKPGQLLAILGPNGVGKTSLLKCLNKIHKPKSGTILVENFDLLRMKPNEIALKIGYVAQKNESSRLTVFDAVLMGRKPHIRWKVSEHDIKVVNSALEHLDLQHLELRYIDELSGGELQKVAIGRALVQEPSLLLFDEPTSSLDLKNQMCILSIIKRIVVEHKVAAVMTMHDINSALRFADRFCFIKGGKVFASGECSQVTSDIIEEVYGLPVSIHNIDNNPVISPKTVNL